MVSEALELLLRWRVDGSLIGFGRKSCFSYQFCLSAGVSSQAYLREIATETFQTRSEKTKSVKDLLKTKNH